MSNRSAEEQSIGTPRCLRFKGDSPILFEWGKCSPEGGGCAATGAVADGLPGSRLFCGSRLIFFVEIEDF